VTSFTAYWDLEVCPPTYDIVAGLMAFERERRRRGADRIDVKIIPGSADGFRRDSFWPHGREARQKMLDAVAVPMARMLPRASVEVLGARPSVGAPGSIGWRQRLYGTRVMVECLRDGIRPLRIAPPEPPIHPRLVTITLREAEHWPMRNSNISEWLAVKRELIRKGYDMVFVRDTKMACEPSLDFEPVNFIASHVLDVRARLYLSATCNMFVNNGPAWFALALDAPAMIFKMISDGAPLTNPSFLAGCGLPVGSQLDESAPHQQIVWQTDNYKSIMAAFEQYVDVGERAMA
jgi:hypothetical protein